MTAPSARAVELASAWRLALLDRRPSGPAGERLARGPGSSLEFHDRRAYAPGDDLRHLDWRAYARTGQLLVKVHTAEVEPRLDVLLDASRSMAAGTGKAQRAVDLAALCVLAARGDGIAARVLVLGDAPRFVEPERFLSAGAELESTSDPADAARAAEPLLRAGALRIFVTDGFTAAADPAVLAKRLAARAGGFGVLQVLAPEDLRPEAGGTARLIDAESGLARDLVLDAPTVEAYRARLRRLADGLETECRRLGGRHALCDSGVELDSECRTVLAPRGVLAPR